MTGPEGAGYDYTVAQMQQVEKRLLALRRRRQAGEPRSSPACPAVIGGSSEEMHTGRAIVFLQALGPARRQHRTTSLEEVRKTLDDMPGVRMTAAGAAGLVRSAASRCRSCCGGPDYDELAQWRDRMLARMEANPGLIGVDSDYKETRPQMRVDIDRARAADLGVTVEDIGHALETMMGSARVTTFVDDGEEYDVMVQAGRGERAATRPTSTRPVRASARSGDAGAAVQPGDAAANWPSRARSTASTACARSRCQRRPGAGLHAGRGDRLGAAGRRARNCRDTRRSTGRANRANTRSPAARCCFTFALALLIVYLVLAAQFESFLHPLVIMLTVPLAVLGALIGLCGDRQHLNLFSQIGIVMLVGLAAKNGILIVEFANQLRDEGRSVARGDRRSRGGAPAPDPDDLDRDDRAARCRWCCRRRRRRRPAARRSAWW